MQSYRVTWEIDIDADSRIQAAREARAIQLDPESIATIFVIEGQEIESNPEGENHAKLER